MSRNWKLFPRDRSTPYIVSFKMLQSALQPLQYWESYVRLDSSGAKRHHCDFTVLPLASCFPQPIKAKQDRT